MSEYALSLRFGRTATEKRFIVVFGAIVVGFGLSAYSALRGLNELHHMMHESMQISAEVTRAYQLDNELVEDYATRIDATAGVKAHNEDVRAAILAPVRDAAVIGTMKLISPKESRKLERIANARAALRKGLDERILPALHRGDIAATQREQARRAALLAEGRAAVADYAAGLETRLNDFDGHANAIAHAGVRNAVLVFAAIALFTAIAGFLLARSIARPVALLHAGSARMAKGDLETRIELTGPSEFRALAEQFNHMVVATRKNQERLVEHERLASVGRLAAGIAHEINNPLGVIRGYTKLLLKRTDDPQTAEDVRVIEQECHRCGEIVKDLLDLSRPAVDNPGSVDLVEIAAEITERLRNTNETGPTLTVSGAGTAWGNAQTLRQIVLNLVQNAVEAAGNDGRVSVLIEPLESGEVQMVVSDTGRGVPPDVHARIFDAFFTTKASGTGLGLAVSRAIARAHRGDISAVNATGGGASFILRVPSTAEETLL